MAVAVAIVCASGAACCNAISSILQRRAAAPAPAGRSSGIGFVSYLFHRPAWFASIAAMTFAFVLQACALAVGNLAEVEPVLTVELLFTLLILFVWFHRPVGRREWLAGTAIVVGLACFLLFASPSSPSSPHQPTPGKWLLVGGAVAVSVTSVLCVGRNGSGHRRAATIGMAAGLGFSFTAAVTKSFTTALAQNGAAAFAGWTPYVLAVCGCGATCLSNLAFERGPVTAAQPALTIVDPLASIVIGVVLFGETLRGGRFVVLEAASLMVLVGGAFALGRSPLAAGGDPGSELQGPPGRVAGGEAPL
jgi:drug/metabolite transporter (DMT)-like permease